MPRMNKKTLRSHELKIFYILIAQGVPKASATFFAKIFQPLTSNPNKSATQRELAAWAEVSPPAAMRHVKYFLGVAQGKSESEGWVLIRDHYRKFRLHPNWRTNLIEAYRESLKKQYQQAKYS